ncbi:Heterodisulfide reductase, subunit B [Gammaproteobacteria bacterium]
MKLSYYPGCTLKSHAQNFDNSTVAAMARLDVEVKELDRWNCCGTVHGLASDDLMHRIAPITNLIRAREESASAFMTSCAMCYNTLKRANQQVRNDAVALAVINDFLSLESTKYTGDVDVVHLLEILRDRIGFEKLTTQVRLPLKGLRVACYYGCLLVRPQEIAIDTVEDPKVMENLMEALGATTVPFALKTECCGAYHTVARPEIIAERTHLIMTAAYKNGANMVVVSCPLCAHNLDQRQEEARRLTPNFHHLPVLYFTQLMAIALGCDQNVLRFDLHHIDPRPVLAGLGLV